MIISLKSKNLALLTMYDVQTVTIYQLNYLNYQSVFCYINALNVQWKNVTGENKSKRAERIEKYLYLAN